MDSSRVTVPFIPDIQTNSLTLNCLKYFGHAQDESDYKIIG